MLFSKSVLRRVHIAVASIVTQPALTRSKLTIDTLEQRLKYVQINNKTQQRRHWCLCGVFIVNFERISNLVLVFLLLTLNM